MRTATTAAALALGLAATGCGGAPRGSIAPTSIDASRHLDAIDASEPVEVWLGRGDERTGLETIYVGPRGGVELHRRHEENGETFWQRARIDLTPHDLIELRVAIDNHRVLALDPGARGEASSGARFVLVVVQGERGHVSAFAGDPPTEAQGFAYDLDQILAQRGLAAVPWARVAAGDADAHDDVLWDALR